MVLKEEGKRMGWQPPGAPPPYPTYHQEPPPPYQAPYPPGHHVHAEGAPRAQPHQGQSLDPYHQPLPPPHPYVADQWRAGDFPPPPQYQPAPREAPQDPPTPPDWPDSSDEARSRKRRRSRSLPARRTSLHRSTIMMTHGFGRPPWSCYSSLLRTTTGSLSALLDCRRSIPGGMK